MKKIVIVEDEKDIANTVEFNLKKEGFNVLSVFQGESAFEKIKSFKPDLVMLDVMLPGIDGFSILRTLKLDKDTSNIPVIMLTARDSEVDRITGLESGADDYVSKPFSMRELIARIKVVLKRYEKKEKLTNFNYKDLQIDFERFIVTLKGKEIKLTSKEFQLLKEFVLSKGRVLTRDYLLDKVWCLPGSVDTRTVDVHVMTLRKKLREYGKLIETIKNTGYRFKIDV